MEDEEYTEEKCFCCGEYKMKLSENEMVYECENCGYWRYSDS